MGRAKLSADRQVLQEKLKIVMRLLEVYADGREQVVAKLHTLAITRPDIPDDELVEAIKHAMVPISEAGVDISFIKKDVDAEKAKLGQEFNLQIANYWRQLNELRIEIAVSFGKSAPPKDRAANIVGFIVTLIDMLSIGLRPALALRDRLTQELNLEKRERVETPGQYNRRLRDLAFQRLSRTHRTKSVAKLVKLAAKDPELLRLKSIGVRVTMDTVRNWVKAQPKR